MLALSSLWEFTTLCFENTVTTFIRQAVESISGTYHQHFIHIEFPARAPVIIFCINGKTQEQYIHYHFVNGQEAMSD